jgi:hypothetical protein
LHPQSAVPERYHFSFIGRYHFLSVQLYTKSSGKGSIFVITLQSQKARKGIAAKRQSRANP